MFHLRDGYVAGTGGPSDYCHRSVKSEIFDTGLSGLTPFDVARPGRRRRLVPTDQQGRRQGLGLLRRRDRRRLDQRPAADLTYAATGGLNQSFAAEIKSDGSYEVDFSGNRSMCLDATGGQAAAGVKLEQWGCNGGNQHWFFKPEGGGCYAVASAQNQNRLAVLPGEVHVTIQCRVVPLRRSRGCGAA